MAKLNKIKIWLIPHLEYDLEDFIHNLKKQNKPSENLSERTDNNIY